MIIKNTVRSIFDNQIILHSVKVSPALNVYIGRIEFRAFEPMPGKKISGFAQQIEFDWSFFLSNEIASLRSAVINLEDKFILDNSAVNIFRNGFWNFNTFQVSASTDLTKVDGLFTAERIDFNSNWDRQELEISKISTQLTNGVVTSGSEIMFKDISVKLDSLDLSENLLNQSNIIEIAATDLRAVNSNVKAKDLRAEIENRQGALIAESSLKEISASNGAFFTNSLSIQFQTKIDELPLNGFIPFSDPILISFEGVSYENYKAGNFEVEALVASAQNPVLINLGMKATDLFLETADFYIGELASISMINIASLDLGFGGSGFKMNVDSSMKVESPSVLSTQIQSEFVSEKDLLKCLAIKCSINNGFFDYAVIIADTKLVGSINCTFPPCNTLTVSHSVETVNTNGFFQNIIDARLFNPLLIMYLQSSIISGDETNVGHKKILQ